jgi:hypothetical protein
VSLRLLDVRDGEWPSVGPALGLAFLAVGAQTLASIASDTLFVSAFDLGSLSGFYVVTSLLRVVVSLGYGAVADRAPGVRAETGLVAVTAAALVLSGLLAPGAPPPLLYGLCALLQLLPTLLPLVAMNAALDCFHARQAKRLLPLVAAAATLGAVAVGGVARLAATTLGTPGLLFLAAALCLGAAPLPAVLAARAIVDEAPRTAPGGAPAAKAGFLASLAEGLRDLGSVPVVRIFAVSAVLGAATTNFVDFAFKAALKAHYGRDEMAAFLGTVNLVTEGGVLFAQLFLTGRLLGRFGIRAALTARPAALLLLAPALALPGVGPATAAKLTETSLRMAISGAVSDLLLAPTPARLRTRVKLLAKSAAAPLGSLASGLALGVFGAAGPPPLVLAAMLAVTAALSVVALLGVRRAFTEALAETLGKGRDKPEVSPANAELLRGELRGMLDAAVRDGDGDRAAGIVSVSDELFRLDDLAPALAPGAPPAAARAAAAAAMRLARPGEGDALLAMLPPGDDDALERRVLARARGLGAGAPRPRLDRALARGAAAEDEAAAELWAEALSAISLTEKDAAVKQLRKAARAGDSPRRAAAIRALGELREARAETEILRGLGSEDDAVYAAAALAAVRIGAAGAVPTLITNLETGTQVRASMAALSQAGAGAVAALLAALPTTRGEGAFRTAVAGSRGMAGTVRAARVLARLGPEACRRALDRFGELGFRARHALIRALATAPPETARALERDRLEAAMTLTLAYAEMLLRGYPAAAPGLLKDELHHRIGETSHRLLDLAAVLGNRALIARARAALEKDARERGNALELLENVLPKGFAARAVALLEYSGGAASGPAPSFDGWLAKCEKFDAGALRSDDPMLEVLEKLVTLREAALFRGLSTEELYPVGEIAQVVAHAPGDVVVRQGDPGDALFVVAKGTLRVKKDDKVLSEMGGGAVFGEMALLDGAPRAATVEAVTEATLLRVPRGEFEALMDESPEIARAVIRLLLGYVRGQR